jgi:hypothetical protein
MHKYIQVRKTDRQIQARPEGTIGILTRIHDTKTQTRRHQQNITEKGKRERGNIKEKD